MTADSIAVRCLFKSSLFMGACAISIALLPPPAQAVPDTTVMITPARIEQGGVGRITVDAPARVRPTTYTWGDISAPFFPDDNGNYFGFIPVNISQEPGPQHVFITLLHADTAPFTLQAAFDVATKDFPVQRISVDESRVTLSPQNLERHSRERDLIQAMYARSEQRRLWDADFIQPLHGRITTLFGVRRFINDQPRNPHSGIDIAAPTGTPVIAAASGIVSLTGEHFFAGKSVYIDHGHDIISMYFHLDAIEVKHGQTVARGERIGVVGATGRATGPHLHWGVRIHGTLVDPFSLLALFEN